MSNSNDTSLADFGPVDAAMLHRATPAQLLHHVYAGNADGDPLANGLDAIASDLDVLVTLVELGESVPSESLRSIATRVRVIREIAFRLEHDVEASR